MTVSDGQTLAVGNQFEGFVVTFAHVEVIRVAVHCVNRRNRPELGDDVERPDVACMKNEIDTSQPVEYLRSKFAVCVADQADAHLDTEELVDFVVRHGVAQALEGAMLRNLASRFKKSGPRCTSERATDADAASAELR